MLRIINKVLAIFLMVTVLGVFCNSVQRTEGVVATVVRCVAVQECYAAEKNELQTYVKCANCGHREKLTKEFICKVIGAAITTLGFWGWVTFLFAGTGLALEICIALVAGGSAILAYSNEITVWLSKKYECPNCKQKNWYVVEEREYNPWY